MKLEQQVCSLELAKRLKELGAIQESVFAWSRPSHVEDFQIIRMANCEAVVWENRTSTDGTIREKIISAFTVAELGEMLPKFYATYKESGSAHLWRCQDTLSDGGEPYIRSENEADARAKMVIHLIENKLLTV
jgi:hypothetical protein